MTTSEPSSNAVSLPRRASPTGYSPKWLAPTFLVVSILGFLDATFLTVEYYRGVVPPCSIVEGCELVTTSQYATVFGVPVALLGAIYYLTILAFTVAYLDRRRDSFLRFAAYLTFAGVAASVWFVYVQLFILKAICLYCMFSAATSTLLFGLGITVLVLGRRKSQTVLIR